MGEEKKHEHKISSLKEVHHHRTKKKKKILGFDMMWVVSLLFVFLVIGFVVAVGGDKVTKVFKGNKDASQTVPPGVADTLTGFVKKVYSSNIKDVKVNSSKVESGLYAFDTTLTYVNGQTGTFTLYMTKDGKYFFPQAIDMAQALARAEQQGQNNQPQNIPKAEKPTVELFTMSYCPFGNQAETGLYPVTKLLKGEVEVVPHYVIYSNYNGGGPKYCLDKDNKYCSMHGISELKQDVRELCIYKYYKDKYWDYVDKVNKDCNVHNIDDCWTGPAKELGISISKITSCFKNEATDLLAKEVELNKKYDVKGSPTLIINGVQYRGGRAPENYKQAICNAFKKAPEKCKEKLGEASAAASGGCQ